jgi:predicted  nucleic acid-binding Zn-ribbon protein
VAGDNMYLPEKGRIEWNLNTIVSLVGFMAMLVAWGITWGSLTSDMRQLSSDVDKLEERMDKAEIEIRKIDGLTYRITATEQSTTTLSRSVEEIKSSLNTLTSDIRVVREILQRAEDAKTIRRQ